MQEFFVARLWTELGYKEGPWLRELMPVARGSQGTEITQPRLHFLAWGEPIP